MKDLGSKILGQLYLGLKVLPQKYLKTVSVSLVVCLGSLSALTIYKSVAKKDVIIPVQHIRFPKHNEADVKNMNATGLKREYEIALEFKLFIDSLALYAPTKKDSIIKLRPGLLDSAMWLLQLYENKNSIIK